MVSELLQQFESEGIEYELRPNGNNDEEFWDRARIFPETIEYEIQDVYRLWEKPMIPSTFDILGLGLGLGLESNSSKDKGQPQQDK